MIKHFRLIPFAIGLIIGFVAIIMIKTEKNVIYKYPTPETAGKIVYKDKNGICYKYNANAVDCDKNESRLKDFPLSK